MQRESSQTLILAFSLREKGPEWIQKEDGSDRPRARTRQCVLHSGSPLPLGRGRKRKRRVRVSDVRCSVRACPARFIVYTLVQVHRLHRDVGESHGARIQAPQQIVHEPDGAHSLINLF